MPARGKDPETNALFKSVLFRPLRAAAGQRASRWVPFRGAVDENGSFAGAWDPWWEEQLSLSRQYEECERRAGKWFTIEDIDLRRAPPGNEAQYFDRFSVRPSAAQFMARWTVEAATNMDVAAEARGRPRVKIRPDGADFAAAELAPVENRPGGDAEEEGAYGAAAVSYTHLTLPTKA